jgi:hypothetical protein
LYDFLGFLPQKYQSDKLELLSQMNKEVVNSISDQKSKNEITLKKESVHLGTEINNASVKHSEISKHPIQHVESEGAESSESEVTEPPEKIKLVDLDEEVLRHISDNSIKLNEAEKVVYEKV